MADRLTKGFNLEQTVLFIDQAFSASERDRIYARLPEQLKGRLGGLRTADWYPIDDQVAFLEAMVAVVSGPEEGERRTRALGRFISDAATGTFMRLVLKVLTPNIFLRKAGSIWPRMFSFGIFESDPSGFGDKRAVMILRDVGGFAHVAGVSAGWIEGVFGAMGFNDVRVRYGLLPDVEPGSGWRFDIDWT